MYFWCTYYYSYLNESTGFNLDAFLAGAMPDNIPTRKENNNVPTSRKTLTFMDKNAGPTKIRKRYSTNFANEKPIIIPMIPPPSPYNPDSTRNRYMI